MFPKIGPAGSRFLESVKAPERPGATLASSEAAKGDDGGYGTLNYAKEDALPSNDSNKNGDNPASDEEEKNREKVSALEFSPGLTQVILEMSANRQRIVSGEAIQQYEHENKEPKDPELTLGSKLDQKAA
jgi:hypothetical protein